jgi:hypothetical protein
MVEFPRLYIEKVTRNVRAGTPFGAMGTVEREICKTALINVLVKLSHDGVTRCLNLSFRGIFSSGISTVQSCSLVRFQRNLTPPSLL